MVAAMAPSEAIQRLRKRFLTVRVRKLFGITQNNTLYVFHGVFALNGRSIPPNGKRLGLTSALDFLRTAIGTGLASV